jgi:hypothetical protein
MAATISQIDLAHVNNGFSQRVRPMRMNGASESLPPPLFLHGQQSSSPVRGLCELLNVDPKDWEL